MPNNFNPMQFMQLIKSGGNPQQLALNLLENNANPLFTNLLALAKNGRGNEIETIARNIFQERGLDFDKEFNSFRKTLGL